jgi:hypothetical protein
VGRNQGLIEALTKMIEGAWNNRTLFDLFCSLDPSQMSGQGNRANTMDFTEMLVLFRVYFISFPFFPFLSYPSPPRSPLAVFLSLLYPRNHKKLLAIKKWKISTYDGTFPPFQTQSSGILLSTKQKMTPTPHFQSLGILLSTKADKQPVSSTRAEEIMRREQMRCNPSYPSPLAKDLGFRV